MLKLQKQKRKLKSLRLKQLTLLKKKLKNNIHSDIEKPSGIRMVFCFLFIRILMEIHQKVYGYKVNVPQHWRDILILDLCSF
ncbi:hypothetical protein HX13_08250 [Chryseobacterium sp. P1-3]|nr:hypothetical protein HX13_08250 [Chryseobacterium sp. P1-3]